MNINRMRPNVLEGLATGLLSLPELEKLMQEAVREELQGIVGEGMLSQEEAASYQHNIVRRRMGALTSREEAEPFQEPPHDPGPAQACSDGRESPQEPASEEEAHARLREPGEQEGRSREEADTILACFTKTRTHLVNSKAKTHLDNPEADTILACFTKTGTHLVNSKA